MPRCRRGNMPGTAQLAVAMGVVAFGLDLFGGRRSLHLRMVGAGLRDQHPAAGRDLRPDILARRQEHPDRGQYRAVAADRRGDRAVSLPPGIPAAGAHLGAGAADRLGRRPPRAAGSRPGVLRCRRPARPDHLGCGLHGGPAALHRPEHRGLRHHHRLHRRRCGCSSASRSMARRCAPPPSTGSAPAWSASAPRCRDRSPSCSPP